MFIAKDQPAVFSAPVSVQLLDEQELQSFTAIFRFHSEHALVALREKNLSDLEFSRLVLAGWEGVFDSDGAPLSYSDEAREKVLGMVPTPTCVAHAFNSHIAEARIKNLNPPRSFGRAAE